MSVQAVAAPDLVVDTPVVMTCLPVFKSELADRPGPVYDYSYMYVGPPITPVMSEKGQEHSSHARARSLRTAEKLCGT